MQPISTVINFEVQKHIKYKIIANQIHIEIKEIQNVTSPHFQVEYPQPLHPSISVQSGLQLGLRYFPPDLQFTCVYQVLVASLCYRSHIQLLYQQKLAGIYPG